MKNLILDLVWLNLLMINAFVILSMFQSIMSLGISFYVYEMLWYLIVILYSKIYPLILKNSSLQIDIHFGERKSNFSHLILGFQDYVTW